MTIKVTIIYTVDPMPLKSSVIVASDPTLLTFFMPRRSRRVLICTTYDNISLFIWYCTYPGSGLHLYHLKIPFTGGCSEGLGVFCFFL